MLTNSNKIWHAYVYVYALLHCVLRCSAVYYNCPCLFVCLFICLWVCYHNNLKLHASIFTKLGL